MTSKRLQWLANGTITCLLLVSTIGCHRGDNETRSESPEQHGHHGGHTFQTSEEVDFQMEFTLDQQRRRIVIYVLQSETHKPHPVPFETLSAEFEADGWHSDVTFAADPRPKDPQGSTSRFALSLDELPQQLLSSNQFLLKLSSTYVLPFAR